MALFCFCYLENKAKTTCEIQYDDKDITVTMDVDTDFQLNGIFEFVAEVKHSISLLHHLGLPFFLKVSNKPQIFHCALIRAFLWITLVYIQSASSSLTEITPG